ncbi:hypothetical protein DM02DRAFT_718227 [Periconia macrospinosa]|uniref:RWD domain-containing protein n=1 Tax=Periconia macrospinosa TaxID=97972 RepID=A0A2V1DR08_9PLEO|nr:hypothetical protein DM02DRAFT_718227 [Periconia macrospinosa]
MPELQDESRLGLELDLLRAMYPEQVEWSSKSREVKFVDQAAALQLRLPDAYPDAGLPDVISASDAAKRDLRDQTKAAVQAAGLEEGEESLDAIIACFQRVVGTNSDRDSQTTAATAEAETSKTVVVWLHHLLALTKRKLALSPQLLSGTTKPGYPGIMIFSGPASAVNEHISTLKAENWQAFQVRYEDEGLWEFEHGSGIREVETMAEVVKAVETGAQGAVQRQEFLKAVGIK